MAKVLSVRYGFATNSSSLHSIIHDAGRYSDREVDQQFGWNEFICRTREAKERYFAQSMYSSVVSYNYTDEMKEQVYEAVLRTFPALDGVVTLDELDDGYVDHQSHIMVPVDVRTDQPAYDFYRQAVQPVIDGDYIIVGGNDNEESSTDYGDREHFELLDLMTERTLRIREDRECWIVMSYGSGTKFRVSKTGIIIDAAAGTELPSDTPELVDLKITNKCSNSGSCRSLCYQNSDWRGAHAPLETIKEIIDECRQMGVFELAIGGGEPTEHPDFLEIIRYARESGMVPNFSTRNLKAFADPAFRQAVDQHCGGFAVSISDFREAIKACHLCGDLTRKMSLQYILEAYPYRNYLEIVDMLEKFHYTWVPLTVLGFKTVGKGAGFDRSACAREHYGHFIAAAKKRSVTLSVDTQIVRTYGKELERAGIDRRSYYRNEGTHSMYIDAVTRSCGPSSYDTANMNPWVKGATEGLFQAFGRR